jgi:hypothetical protein
MVTEVKTSYFPLGGGLDIATPTLSMPPGRALALVNFEPWFNGGYRRIDGFERYDGRPSPHEQTFIGFDVSSVEDVVVGNTITGGTSAATGVVIGVYEDDGTFGSDVLAVTKVTGTFVNGESIGVAATNVDHQLLPDTAITDVGANIASGLYTDINEGIEDAQSLSGLYRDDDVPALRSVSDEWAANPVLISLSPLDAGAATVVSWTLRVRARVLRDGPETDDTATYSFTFGPGADSQTIDFTEADVGGGWITRTVEQAVSAASVANVNAESVILSQSAYAQNGYAADGLRLEVDAVDVIAYYDGTTNIRSAPLQEYAPNQDVEDEFLLAAQAEYRSDIAVVPGLGPVRGAWRRFDDVYAIRNNVGNTAGVLHKSSASGWTTAGITLSRTLFYTGGTDAADPDFILEGDSINGATSGATAVVHRVIIHSGAPGTNDAAGYLVLTSVVGNFSAAENIRVGANVVAVATAVQTTFAFPPGGKYRFLNHNFFGSTGTYNVYGVNGVGPAFEIDENSVVSPILFPAVAATDQPASNVPFLIEEHKNYLFLAFPGGRFVQSVVGEPLVFNGFLGAAEFGMGSEITGLNSVVGTVLIVNTETETRGLFGVDVTDWDLKLIGERTGGKLFSLQKLDTVYGLDSLGITSIKRTDAFGAYGGSTVSQSIQPLIDSLRDNLNDSTIVRRSNQYRAYFTDSQCLIMYVPAPGSEAERRGEIRSVGAAFGFASYPFAIKSVWNTEDENGLERAYFVTESTVNAFGTSTPNEGYVFEDLVGGSFDGDTIRSSARIAFNFLKSPAYRKHFWRAELEINSTRALHLRLISDLTFGNTEGDSSQGTIDIVSGGNFWDVGNWDEFIWDGQNLDLARVGLGGSGENIGFLFYNESAITDPFILQSLIVHYSLRRLQR